MKNLQARLCAGSALAFSLAAFALPTMAHAQDGASSGKGLGDIIVTAQRRAEKLQDVPLAITAVSGDTLANYSSSDFTGISQMSPSLTVGAYPGSSDTIALTMRGQGIADPGQITKDGGVGLYVDGFYISRPQGTLLDLGDPERIEVLRGPQGTLYGRNTTGGAVNIITKKPTGEWGGVGSITVGSRNMMRGLAELDLPEVANISVKGTILYSQQDGWVKNPRQAHDFHEMGQLAGRVAVRWAPASNFTVDYTYDRGRVTSTPPYFINPDLIAIIPDYNPDKSHAYTSYEMEQSKSLFTDHQLTVNWDASDALTLRSLSSYRKASSYQFVNYGPAYAPPFPGQDFFIIQHHDFDTKQYSQEFQLIGSIGDVVDYTGGLYYFEEKGSHDLLQELTGALVGGYLQTRRLVDSKSTSKAAYLQATFTPPVWENRVKLTLGGRYTEDKRRASRNQWFFDAHYEQDTENNQKFTNFSPSANLAIEWTPEVMTYLRYSHGYKSGGSVESGFDFTSTYGPEKVRAWELGLKSQFFDNRVLFNAAIFYNKFKDMQLDFTLDPYDLSQVDTINAGGAVIKGAEVELQIRPTDRVGLQLSYAYLDPKLKRVLAPANTNFDPLRNPVSPVQVGDDVTGYFTIPFAPRHAVTATGDWRMFDDGEHSLTAFVSFSYRQAQYGSAVAGPLVPNRHYWRNATKKVVNARLVWAQPLGLAQTSASVFVNNLFDRRVQDTYAGGVGGQIDTLAGPGGFVTQTAPYTEPRVIGAQFKVTF